MCLYTEEIEGEVSNKPIKCYKVYRKTKEGVLESFYKYGVYDLKEGDEVIAEGESLIDEHFSKSGIMYYTFNSGFIHAWKRQESCIDMLFAHLSFHAPAFGAKDKYMSQFFEDSEGFCLCEMEIPAGEMYWVGGDTRDVCAERMIYRGVIRTVTGDDLKKMAQEVRSHEELMRRLTEMFDK